MLSLNKISQAGFKCANLQIPEQLTGVEQI
jgi:hypothetical protein